MCSINFSNTSSNFREQVAKAASNNVISQVEIADLDSIAQSKDEKNFVTNLQSKANFQDLQISSFDPEKANMVFDIPPKTMTAPVETSVSRPLSKATHSENSHKNEHEPERVNMITPLLGAIGMILAVGSGAAYNDKLDEAISKSLQKGADAINRHGINTPVVGKFEDEEDVLERHRKMATGEA
jgi:hypothetical protein